MPDRRPLALLAVLSAWTAFCLTAYLRERRAAHGGTLPGLQAGADTVLNKLRGLAGLGWLPRLLGDGDLSSTRFVFLGAFGVGSVVLVILYAAIAWRFLRAGTTDASLCVLAGGALGTFFGFATNAQNTKNKTTAKPDPQPGDE